MKKLLVVGVIGLFLGLAIAPSINANVSKESELVAITTEICGLDGGKQTVQLSKEEVEEVDKLFENIRQQLNESTSREGAEKIFNEAIVELDKYGLLGGLSIKQAQRLVTGRFKKYKVLNHYKKIDSNCKKSLYNAYCLIIGCNVTECWFLRPIHSIVKFHFLFWDIFLSFYSKIPQCPAIFSAITFGGGGWYEHVFYAFPSTGTIITDGKYGKQSYTGSFCGNIRGVPTITFSLGDYKDYVGATGFTGYRIFDNKYGKTDFIGFAMVVNIDDRYEI
jgi:hypothetical protein